METSRPDEERLADPQQQQDVPPLAEDVTTPPAGAGAEDFIVTSPEPVDEDPADVPPDDNPEGLEDYVPDYSWRDNPPEPMPEDAVEDLSQAYQSRYLEDVDTSPLGPGPEDFIEVPEDIETSPAGAGDEDPTGPRIVEIWQGPWTEGPTEDVPIIDSGEGLGAEDPAATIDEPLNIIEDSTEITIVDRGEEELPPDDSPIGASEYQTSENTDDAIGDEFLDY